MRCRGLKKIFIFLIAGLVQHVAAQSPVMVFDKLDFPGFTRAVFQDSRGFTWFATKQGVFRYDGIHFRHYQHQSENKNSISSDEVWSIAEDSDHFIWFGTQTGGISRYDYTTNQFINFLKDTLHSNSLGENEVLSVAADNNGAIWAATSGGGLVKIIKDPMAIQGYRFYSFRNIYGDNQTPPSNRIWSLAFDENNFGYAGTFDKGLSIFNASLDVSKIKFRNIYINRTDNSKKNIRIDGISYDSLNKQVWLFSGLSSLLSIALTNNPMQDSLVMTDFLKAINEKQKIKITTPLAFFVDSKKQCWLSTEDYGTLRFNLNFLHGNKIELNKFVRITKGDSSAANIRNEVLTTFFEDEFGNIWIGTESGVLKFNHGTEDFQYEPLQNIFAKVQDQGIINVCQNKTGDLFFTCNQNYFLVYRQNRIEKIFPDYTFNRALNSDLKIVSIKQLQSGDCIIAGNIGTAIITSHEIVKSVNTNSYQPKVTAGTFITEAFTPGFFPLAEISGNRIFMGTGKGLYELNCADMNLSQAYYSKDTGSLAQRVRSLLVMPDHILWIGTDLGIFAYDYQKKQRVDFKNLIHAKSKIPEEYISVLKKDSAGNVWIGTSNALYRFDATSKIISSSPLMNEHVSTIELDRDQNLWAGTYSGIANYRVSTDQLYNYDKSDGLFSSVYYETGSTTLSDGTIVMCGDKGINYFQPNNIIKSNIQPQIRITDFEVDFVSVLNDTASLNKTLRKKFFSNEVLNLGYDQKSLKFEFAALNYLSPEKNRYQYKLDGFDNQWNDLGNNSFVYYSAVKSFTSSILFPGAYTFLVRVSNADGSWVEMKNPLQFSIKPHWSKSIEFLSLLALIILGVIIYIVRYLSHQKLKEQIREQEKLLAIERERNRISEDLHDDLGAGLSSIAMMTGVMKDLVTDEDARVTADDVSTEATELVGRMREIIWSMNSKNDTVENLISYLHEYSSKYLARNKIECEFELHGNIPDQNIRGDKRENIFLVNKETLHNIVKYAQSLKVNIDVSINEKKLTVEVFDNGKGFDMNNIQRFGNGLTNMKQRLENVGGRCIIQSVVSKGTKTIMEVPIS